MEHTAPQSAEPTRRWSPIALLGKLEKSGVKRETATILVEVLEEAHEHQNATKADLKETKTELLQELKNTEQRLQLEIEKVRREIKEIDNCLQLEIEKVRREIKESENRLQLEIEKVRGYLETKIAETKSDLIKWMVGAMIAQAGIIVGVLGFLIKFS